MDEYNKLGRVKMLNIIWPLFIIISIVYGLFAGRMEQINNAIFDSAASAVELSITFFGTLCLWNRNNADSI